MDLQTRHRMVLAKLEYDTPLANVLWLYRKHSAKKVR
jgi:hypothetical protein